MRFDASNYIPVQDRINRFWQEFPEGRIETELASMPSDIERALYRASVYRHAADPHPAATGYSLAIAGTGGANQTAWHENAETSAIGRALANFGYATSMDDRPSREEMVKSAAMEGAVAPRPAAPPQGGADWARPTEKQVWLFTKLLKESGLSMVAAFELVPELAPAATTLNVDKLDKFQISKAIEAMKLRAGAMTPATPSVRLVGGAQREPEPSPFDGAPEPEEPNDEVPF